VSAGLALLALGLHLERHRPPALCDSNPPSGGLGDRLLVVWELCAAGRLLHAEAHVTWRHAWSVGRARAYLAFQFPPPVTVTYWWPTLGVLSWERWRRCLPVVDGPVPRAVRGDPQWLEENRRCARETRLRGSLAHLVCAAELADVTGVHIRRGDKMMTEAVAAKLRDSGSQGDYLFQQTDADWRLIARRTLEFARMLIRRNETRFYVSGDEHLVVAGFEAKLRALGGSIVDPGACHSPAQAKEYAALGRLRAANVVDMQRFAACRRVLQVAKYSSYSTSASLMGSGRLINFYGLNGSAIALRAPLVRPLFFTPSLPDNGSVVGEPLVSQDAAGCTADNLFCKHVGN